MLLDKDRRGIPYRLEKLSGWSEEPPWRKVLRENTPMNEAFSVRLSTTHPRRVREGCGSDHQAQQHVPSCCAQNGKIEDLSWRRTMELCCKHLDLVEVHTVS